MDQLDGVFFSASLLSAFSFVLDAPYWDSLQWVFIWLAIPVYCIVFKLVGKVSKRQYSLNYYKSRTIVWSSTIVALLLCLAYAMVTTDLPLSDASGVLEALENRSMPFADSSCAIMAEVDKVNTYWTASSNTSCALRRTPRS